MAEKSDKKKGSGIFRIFLVGVFSLAVVTAGSLFAIGLTSYHLFGIRDVVSENAAIEMLHQIAERENQYFDSHGEYGTLDQLVRNGFLEKDFADDPVRLRYVFSVDVTPKSNVQPPAYHASASPRKSEKYIFIPTWRHFYIGSDVNEIRVSDSRPATATDLPLKK